MANPGLYAEDLKIVWGQIQPFSWLLLDTIHVPKMLTVWQIRYKSPLPKGIMR